MLRITTPPRLDWPKLVESQGLLFHSIDGVPYWDESAYYLFEAREVDAIEQATYQLDKMCLEAVDHVITQGRLDVVGVPEAFHGFVEESWDRDEQTIYGRFDLSFNGSGPPKLLEFNADTPTSLLEAGVVQWFWAENLREAVDDGRFGQFDQFNSIHERLIEAWERVRRELGPNIAFASLDNTLEDNMTAAYLRDTAIQGGMRTESIPVESIGWSENRRVFTDLRERPIPILFKLYPWEWMLREEFGRHLPEAPTRFLEPPWKMVLSSKGILPILYELFPDSPYLLPAGFEPTGSSYVAKPTHSREGANITIVQNDQILAETGGEYGEGPWVYQQYHPLPNLGGHYPVIGSWTINGHACGMGVREDDGPITRNTSRFVPHLFRKSPMTKPPVFPANHEAGRPASSQNDPLWDRWIDR